MPQVVSAIQGASEADRSFHIPPPQAGRTRYPAFTWSRNPGASLTAHAGRALRAFCSSALSLARSVSAKASAASFDSKLRTVSWSSMVTTTAYTVAPVGSLRGAISILNDIPLFRALGLSLARASAQNEAGQAPSRFERTHDPAKTGGSFLIDTPHE